MENPLAKLLPVEERADGVYIAVSPEKKAELPIDHVLMILEKSSVLNYDQSKIREVFARAKNAPERIGPPFEYYNALVERYITINVSPRKATMRVNAACYADGIKPSAAMLYYLLKLKGVCFGLQKEAIAGIIDKGKFDADIVVAVANEPVNPTSTIFWQERAIFECLHS
jgi:hypothetical protein